MKAPFEKKRAKLVAKLESIKSDYEAKAESYAKKLWDKSEAKIMAIGEQIEKLDAILLLLDEKPIEK